VLLGLPVVEQFAGVAALVADRVQPGAVALQVGRASNTGTGQIRPGGLIPGRPVFDILGDQAGRITFMKVDIEGSERPILEDLLERCSDLSPAAHDRRRGFTRVCRSGEAVRGGRVPDVRAAE